MISAIKMPYFAGENTRDLGEVGSLPKDPTSHSHIHLLTGLDEQILVSHVLLPFHT